MCYPHVSISMFVVSEFVQAVCVRATVPVLPMMDQHQGGHSEPSQPFCPQTLIQICTPWSTKKDHRCLFTIDFSKTIEELLEEPWLHQLETPSCFAVYGLYSEVHRCCISSLLPATIVQALLARICTVRSAL
ncbi:uncharacterized protein LOC133904864 isoform X2 [Phragmites australis]|uniref:uncharacterized protein LOC133904864 isoform X2 n=1 Tax=Phragmites australis TaxID=29695 RepID=UPI002D7762A9|nr:uncharacterized protein LOC133904864 isoform X2 [Phragmites australis]